MKKMQIIRIEKELQMFDTDVLNIERIVTCVFNVTNVTAKIINKPPRIPRS